MGLFEPGKPRHPNAGRRKGSLNKLSMAAMDRIAELGVDPFLELRKIARKTQDEAIRVRVYSIMCEYIYPKRRAVEHTGSIEHTGQVDIRAAIMQVIAKLPEDQRAVIARGLLELEKAG